MLGYLAERHLVGHSVLLLIENIVRLYYFIKRRYLWRKLDSQKHYQVISLCWDIWLPIWLPPFTAVTCYWFIWMPNYGDQCFLIQKNMARWINAVPSYHVIIQYPMFKLWKAIIIRTYIDFIRGVPNKFLVLIENSWKQNTHISIL